MTNWLEIAKRCEQATGPDREIDCDITEALGQGPGEGWIRVRHRAGVYDMDAGRWEKGCLLRTPSPLTASLDAITALIERELPGWGRSVTYRRPGVAYACVIQPEAMVEIVRSEATTEALALCAAFCRAMAEEDKP